MGLKETIKFYPKIKSALGYIWIDGIIVALSLLLPFIKAQGIIKKIKF